MHCHYVDGQEGICNITNSMCIHTYWCTKANAYRFNAGFAPDDCNVAKRHGVPEGMLRVCKDWKSMEGFIMVFNQEGYRCQIPWVKKEGEEEPDYIPEACLKANVYPLPAKKTKKKKVSEEKLE